MSEQVERAIRGEIARDGPITFARFMEIALYGSGGFYERPPVGEGPGTHFATSPHVHGIFAELLADGFRAYWVELGRPSPLRIVEAGAGDGTLARQLLTRLSDVPVEYFALERSTGARASLAELDGMQVIEHLSDVPPLDPGVVLANELLDNLPFRRARATDAGLVEVRIGVDDGGTLSEIETTPDEEVRGLAPADLETGDDVAIPSAGAGFLGEIAWSLVRGVALLVDYGGVTGRAAGETHGYREHRVVEDVLADPGAADITAGVDFSALSPVAERSGLRVDGIPTQREALALLGYEGWARGELERQGALLRSGGGTEAVRIWSERNRAQLLVDPTGLGRLRWFSVSAGDAPTPPWIGADTDP